MISNSILQILNEEKDIIKHLHLILKHETKDYGLNWFVVGVPEQMESLLSEYNSKKSITVNDVIFFHAEFEHIHPFQDGNGKVGCLVALKECLHHDIVLFIIEDRKKYYY